MKTERYFTLFLRLVDEHHAHRVGFVVFGTQAIAALKSIECCEHSNQCSMFFNGEQAKFRAGWVEGAAVIILRRNGKLIKQEKARENHLKLVPVVFRGFPFRFWGMGMKNIRKVGRP